MNKISKEKIEEIKVKNNIHDVISKYVKLTSKGGNLIGLCPFHNEKNPSFTVYPEKDSFYCFGCGIGGDIIEFIQRIEKIDYISAVKLLAERSGVKITEDAEDNYYIKMRNKILAINQEAAKFYQSYLKSANGKWAVEYLSNRGLSSETIEKYQLEKDKITNKLATLYNDRCDGLISAEVYKEISKKLEIELKQINITLEEEQQKRYKIKNKASILPDYTKKIKELLDLNKPKKELIDTLIERIVIDKDRNITIYYKYDVVPSVSFKYEEITKPRNPYGKKGKNNNMKNK